MPLQTNTPTSAPLRTAGAEEATAVIARYPGPYKCPLHGLRAKFNCSKCGRVYPTVHGAATHYCRCKAPSGDDGHETDSAHLNGSSTIACPQCGLCFLTNCGLQLHRRRQHPDEFAADQIPEKKCRWTRFEVEALAKLEAKLPTCTKFINQELEKLLFEKHGLCRNTDMIKGQRRKDEYKALVSILRCGDVSVQSTRDTRAQQTNVCEEELRAELVNEARQFDCDDSARSFLNSCLLLPEPTSTLEAELIALARRALDGEMILDCTASVLLDRFPPPERRNRNTARRATVIPRNNRQSKQMRFKEFKRLYNTNRKRLAEVIFDEAVPRRVEIPLDMCVEYYKKVSELSLLMTMMRLEGKTRR
uniref:C2H2-type domain-containing protein n=1 Tax=Trichuris muris TaxID=70415 RepID=A0A5S6QFV8_TRIMR